MPAASSAQQRTPNCSPLSRQLKMRSLVPSTATCCSPGWPWLHSSHVQTNWSSRPHPVNLAAISSTRVQSRAPYCWHRPNASRQVAFTIQPPIDASEWPQTPYSGMNVHPSIVHVSVEVAWNGIGGGSGGGDGGGDGGGGDGGGGDGAVSYTHLTLPTNVAV